MVLLILLMMPVHLLDLQFTLNIGVAIVVLIAALNVKICLFSVTSARYQPHEFVAQCYVYAGCVLKGVRVCDDLTVR